MQYLAVRESFRLTATHGFVAPIGRATPLQGEGCQFKSDRIHETTIATINVTNTMGDWHSW